MEDDTKDTRWKQRYQNFEKAYRLLERTGQIPDPSEAERAGLIQFFEMTFELAWKMIRDYLVSEGFTVQSPKEAIKQAFQTGLITDGHAWIAALNDRNLTVHTYDEDTAVKVERKIKQDYFPLLEALYDHFQAML